MDLGARAAGLARRQHLALPEPGLLALGEAGVIPYYTGRPVLDLFGLTDAHIARLPGSMHQKVDVEYVLNRRPRYVLLVFDRTAGNGRRARHPHASVLLKSERFQTEYATRKDFGDAVIYERVAQR